jgi:dihydrofolate synthase/folylpolyglutamate synthase
VGLGGRLDSTNIIQPILSIITNISFDHTNMLGNTLAEIAREKGGIIKQQTPVIIGQKSKETDAVFTSIAQEKEASIYFAEDAYKLENYQLKENEITINVFSKSAGNTDAYVLDLPGIYQTKNIITVLQAYTLLQKLGFTISHQNLKKGLATVKKSTHLQGRWDVIHNKPLVVLEVAHNEAGVQQMLEHLAALYYEKLHIIIGAVKDKEVNKVLQLLPSTAAYYFTQAGIPRALEASALKTAATAYGLHGQTYTDVNTALKDALDKANEKDLIIVCGSIFLVAEVDKNVVNT